jgi:hypothetical protein
LLERGKSNAGRKRIYPMILFKMLILQQLFNLSDKEFEFQVNERRSFEEFVGLGVVNIIPDATTIAFFRDGLRKAAVIEELFEMFETLSSFSRPTSSGWPDYRRNSAYSGEWISVSREPQPRV